jgi:Cu2+-exporting ATPase
VNHEHDKHHHRPAGHDQHAGHSVAMFRDRFWLSLLLTLPVVFYSEMVQAWFGYQAPLFPGSDWIAPVLGTVIFVYGGAPFLRGAVREARDRQPGMMLLIGMAITVAFVASAATTLGWFDLEFWWELAALITIMLLGHWMEMRAIGQARGSLAALAELLPDEAERVTEEGTETVTLAHLVVGDVVLVRPGGRVPADGEIVRGEVELDESMVTGESLPVSKGPGDRVVAGTIATDNSIRLRVSAVGEQTTLAGIQRLIAQAQQSRSRAQVLADRAAAWLFYLALAAAAVTVVALGSRPATGAGGGEGGSGPGDRMSPCARARHPPGHRHFDVAGSPERDPGARPPRLGEDAEHGDRLVRQDRNLDQGKSPAGCGGLPTRGR